jgi:hypothetical protein
MSNGTLSSKETPHMPSVHHPRHHEGSHLYLATVCRMPSPCAEKVMWWCTSPTWACCPPGSAFKAWYVSV